MNGTYGSSLFTKLNTKYEIKYVPNPYQQAVSGKTSSGGSFTYSIRGVIPLDKL